MDKPLSMSVKDYLMRVFSVRHNIPLKTIEEVINFQFSEANRALKDNHSVEISGFGKFIFNHKKAQKALDLQYYKIKLYTEKLNNPETGEVEKKKMQQKLEIVHNYINLLKPKLDGLKTDTTDLRGVEKQADTIEGTRGSNLNSIPGQEKDM